MLTVAQVCRVAGVTPRTLHYYDEIDLLEPTEVGENGYRYYDERALLRLQQILLYRELEIPLGEIKRILGRSEFDILSALAQHRSALEARIGRMQRLLATVDETIEHIREERPMDQARIFSGFNKEEQERYAEEAEERWDPQTVRESNRRWNAMSEEEQQGILSEGNEIYADLARLIDDGPETPSVQDCVKRWHEHIKRFWSPKPEQLVGLAELYSSDERFKKNLDHFDPRLAAFMKDAVGVYAAGLRGEEPDRAT